MSSSHNNSFHSDRAGVGGFSRVLSARNFNLFQTFLLHTARQVKLGVMSKNKVKIIVSIIMLFLLSTYSWADESIIYTDGIGAKIQFYLPTKEIINDSNIEFTTYRITAEKDGKILLLSDLSGTITENGKYFQGSIIIPQNILEYCEIILLGAPKNSSMGLHKKIKVSSFKKVEREKSWTKN